MDNLVAHESATLGIRAAMVRPAGRSGRFRNSRAQWCWSRREKILKRIDREALDMLELVRKNGLHDKVFSRP